MNINNSQAVYPVKIKKPAKVRFQRARKIFLRQRLSHEFTAEAN
jgi:hypothetical protein